ncbi:MAG: biotin--[acetyl-CoA-carboxylase] ligase [Alphaproteobacteria bacterium]
MHSEPLPRGFDLRHWETLGSTNDEAARLAAEGAPSGTIVVADRQTAGRGRLGRVWESPAGNLHASIILRPDCALQAASQLSLLAAVALAETLAEHGPDGLDLKLKWPNDVLIGGAKVAGILLESAADKAGRLEHVIVGVGLNLVWAPRSAAYPVTSLQAEGFTPRTAHAWIAAYVGALGNWLDRWQRDGFAEARQVWRARSYGLGGPIRLRLNREEVKGRFIDLTEGGALLIERENGQRSELTVGDIVFADH